MANSLDQLPLTLENSALLYTGYETLQPDIALVSGMWQYCAQRYNPLTYGEDTGALEQLHELKQANTGSIIIANHIAFPDQNVVAGALAKSVLALEPHRTRILSKKDHFELAQKISFGKTELLLDRPTLEKLGVIPVFRTVDYPREGRAVAAATFDLISLCVKLLERGDNILFFPEGTRNTTGRPEEVQKFPALLSHILDKSATQDIKTAVLPIGIAYAMPDPLAPHGPSVHIGAPHVFLPTETHKRHNKYSKILHGALQLCVTAAQEQLGKIA